MVLKNSFCRCSNSCTVPLSHPHFLHHSLFAHSSMVWKPSVNLIYNPYEAVLTLSPYLSINDKQDNVGNG